MSIRRAEDPASTWATAAPCREAETPQRWRKWANGCTQMADVTLNWCISPVFGPDQPAVAHVFLISLPPHWPTRQDGCFIPTYNLPSALSYSRRFCSPSSFLAAPFTLFQVPHLCFYVSRLVLLSFCLLEHLWIPAPGSHFCSCLLSLSSCRFFVSRSRS